MKKIAFSLLLLTSLSFAVQAQVVFEKVIRPQTTDSIIAANCGVQSHDGGYMLAGAYQPSGVYAQEMLLIKTDSLGNELWRKFYGAVPNSDNVIRGIAQLADSSYVCAAQGSFQEPEPGELAPVNSLVFRVDKNGDMMWHREFDLGYHEHVYDLAASDTSFIAVGYCQDMDKGPVNTSWIVSNFEGTVVNTHIESLNASIPSSVCSYGNSGFLIGTQEWKRALYIKTSGSGNIIDSQYVGTDYQDQFTLKDHTILNDTVIACGSLIQDVSFIPTTYMLDESLSMIDSIIFNHNYPYSAQAEKIVLANDNKHFIIAGRYNSENRNQELFIEKFSLDLESKWYHTIGSVKSDMVNDLIATDDGGYLIVGDTDGFTNLAGFPGIYLVKIDSLGEGNYTSPVPQIQSEQSGIKLFPNPTANIACIIIPENIEIEEILIYDISGKLHIKKKLISKRVELNLDRLRSGIYIVTDNRNQFREKLLIY